MRTFDELDTIPASSWTEDEAFAHLSWTFDTAARQFPDLLEPYVVMLTDIGDDAEYMSVMQRGLRETLNERHPMQTAKGWKA